MRYWFVLLLLILLCCGCDDSSVKPVSFTGNSSTTSSFSDLYPSSELAFGLLGSNGQATTLQVPGIEWDEEIVGKMLYLINCSYVIPFIVLSLDTTQDHETVAVLPLNTDLFCNQGLVFWSEIDTLEPQSPNYETSDNTLITEDNLRETVEYAIQSWGLGNSGETQLSFLYIMLGENLASYQIWLTQAGEETNYYSLDGPIKKMSPFQWSNQGVAEDANYSVPWGVNGERETYVADLDKDDFADILGVWLQGTDGPLQIYARSSTVAWSLIFEGNPLVDAFSSTTGNLNSETGNSTINTYVYPDPY